MIRRPRRLLVVGLLLSAFDGTATYLWLRGGVAFEGNPLLARAMATSGLEPVLMGRIAFGAAALLCLYWIARHVWLARIGLVFVALALGGIGLWHLVGAITLLT